MNVVTKRFISLIIGIILLVIGLLLNRFNMIRFFLCLVSIILLTYSSQLERDNKKLFIPLCAIFFFFFILSLDYLCVCTLKRIPIFSYSVVKNEEGTVYNSFGYRVWSCKNNTFKVDPLYKVGYFCDVRNAREENINNVLSTVVNNFDEYKGTYVKIIGRVASVIDSKSFYMQSYKEENGIIKFDETNKLYVLFDVEDKTVSNLMSGSVITVSGKIERKEDSDIYMIDSKVVKENESAGKLYVENDNGKCEYAKEYWFSTSTNTYYKSCIKDINMNINNNNYNLASALQNNIITLDEIKNEANAYLTQSKDNSKMYVYDYFKILVCDSSKNNDIIIGQTTMEFGDGYCK